MEPETTQRFLADEPRKEFALKTAHDREDLIELPEFVNIPSDQGIAAGEPEEAHDINDKAAKEEPLKQEVVPHEGEQALEKAQQEEEPSVSIIKCST